MELIDPSPESSRVARLERQLDAARALLLGVQQLRIEVQQTRAELPAVGLASWRSEASEQYAGRLDELIGRTELSIFSLEQSEREIAGGIGGLENELYEAQAAERAAAIGGAL